MTGMLTSKMTERAQTTLPSGVRAVLGLRPGERLGYIIQGSDVRLVNASAMEEASDPVVQQFLEFVVADMTANPARVSPFPPSLLQRARDLTKGVVVDHDAPLNGVTAL